MRTVWRSGALLLAGLVCVGGQAGAGEAPAGGPEPSRVVAKVRSAEITYGDLKARVEALERERGPVPVERYGEVLRVLVREEVLAQAAVAEALEQDAKVKTRLAELRRQVLIDELLKKKLEALPPLTDEEVQRTYEANAVHFSREANRVSHIMVATQADAESIRAALLAGQDFASLARARSQDAGSAEKGGDLGILQAGAAEPEFEKAAARLKEGEISPVVKSGQGYHVLKGGGREKVVQPLSEVRDRLVQMLERDRQHSLLAVYVASQERIAMPEVFEERLR
ncbi:MAG: peptidylprolyl isomerase [Candidatus Methylomirabilota bacterium]